MIVVGGGISGLSIALQLKSLGVPKVTVLERHHVGAGQSGRAAGIIRALVNQTAVASILLESLRFWNGFNRRFDEGISVNQPGYLLVERAARTEVMDQVIRNAGAAGCEARRLSQDAAIELQPGLKLESGDICAYEPAAIHLDPMVATQALARIVRRMGTEIEEGVEVESIIVDRSRIRGVNTRTACHLADKVVIATLLPFVISKVAPGSTVTPLDDAMLPAPLSSRVPLLMTVAPV